MSSAPYACVISVFRVATACAHETQDELVRMICRVSLLRNHTEVRGPAFAGWRGLPGASGGGKRWEERRRQGKATNSAVRRRPSATSAPIMDRRHSEGGRWCCRRHRRISVAPSKRNPARPFLLTMPKPAAAFKLRSSVRLLRRDIAFESIVISAALC